MSERATETERQAWEALWQWLCAGQAMLEEQRSTAPEPYYARVRQLSESLDRPIRLADGLAEDALNDIEREAAGACERCDAEVGPDRLSEDAGRSICPDCVEDIREAQAEDAAESRAEWRRECLLERGA